MFGDLTIGEALALLVLALFFVGIGRLVRRFPEIISGINTLPEERRKELDLPQIGAFVAKWLNVSAVAVLLGLLIPDQSLRWQVAICVPVFLIMLSAAYLLKYRSTRFKKEN